MKERPILFSGPMVQALLAWLKTQTRRVIKPVTEHGGWQRRKDEFLNLPTCERTKIHLPNLLRACPYGQPGDRLWVRESAYLWGKMFRNGKNKKGNQKWSFKAVGQRVMYEDNRPAIVLGPRSHDREGWFKRPSIFMPRWASRITLEITDVRVQRVQEISGDDARAEGIERSWPSQICQPAYRDYKQKKRDVFEWFGKATDSFQTLWDSINAARGYGWAANPWVWAITFRRVAP